MQWHDDICVLALARRDTVERPPTMQPCSKLNIAGEMGNRKREHGRNVSEAMQKERESSHPTNRHVHCQLLQEEESRVEEWQDKRIPNAILHFSLSHSSIHIHIHNTIQKKNSSKKIFMKKTWVLNKKCAFAYFISGRKYKIDAYMV